MESLFCRSEPFLGVRPTANHSPTIPPATLPRGSLACAYEPLPDPPELEAPELMELDPELACPPEVALEEDTPPASAGEHSAFVLHTLTAT